MSKHWRYNLILGSASPRRRSLLKALDIDFEVFSPTGIDESFSAEMPANEVPEFLSKKKSYAILPLLPEDTLLITADTVVILQGEIFGKPKNKIEARRMLHSLSGKVHSVITGVCLSTKDRQVSFSEETKVKFACLTDNEIDYYIEHYKPFDKAGSYGIQEWIGFVGVERIEGDFNNVVGLPVYRLYKALCEYFDFNK